MSEAGKEYGQFVKQRREERYSQFVNTTLPAIKSEVEECPSVWILSARFSVWSSIPVPVENQGSDSASEEFFPISVSVGTRKPTRGLYLALRPDIRYSARMSAGWKPSVWYILLQSPFILLFSSTDANIRRFFDT